MKFLSLTISFFALLLGTFQVQAYQPLSNVTDPQNPPQNIQFKHWKNLPITLKIDGGSFGQVNGKELIQNALKTWNNVPKAQKVFNENIIEDTIDYTSSNIGTAFGKGFVGKSSYDGVVEVVFDHDGSIMRTLFGDVSQILGVGLTLFDQNTGEIKDALLILSGERTSNSSSDLLATAIHELGHILGLAHSSVGAQNSELAKAQNRSVVGLDPIKPEYIPTMWWASIYPDDRLGRTLALDDMLGLIELYPEGGL